MAWVALVGAILSVAAQQQAGREREATANYQAEQAQADALAERDQGELNASAIRRQGRKQLASANVALAASGLGLESPGAININEDINRSAELDARNAILTGQRRSDNLNASAQALRIGGKQARDAANVNSVTTLLSSASSYGSSSGWFKSNNTNTTNTQRPTYMDAGTTNQNIG